MFKKSIALLLCAIMCICAVPFVSVETEAASDVFKTVSFSTPTVLGDNGGYPRMASLPDGTLLLTSSSSTKVLRINRSTDGGKTWGADEVVVDYTGTDYLPANSYLYYDAPTEVLYFAYRCPITYADGTYEANANYLTSTDGGKTWSDIKTICRTTSPSDYTTYGGIWEPTIYRTGGKLRVYYSSDVVKCGNGLVLNPGTEYEAYDTDFPYSKTIVTQNIVMHELDEETGAWGGGKAVFPGYSSTLINEYGYPKGTKKMRAGMQSISRLADGTYVMAIETTKLRDWGDYGGLDFPMVIDVCFSRDGVTFTEPRTIAQGHAGGYTSAAPWVVALPDGRIAVSFQTDDSLSEPHPTEVGNYKQLHVVVSQDAVAYEDNVSISIDDFDRYKPFDVYNSEVTFNYWNSLFVDGYKLYVVGNHNTNDKKTTPAKGMLISVADLTPTGSSVTTGYLPLYTANDVLNLMNRETGYSWSAKYKLMNDIDLSTATNGLSQTPIGYKAGTYTTFSGIFDGNGYTISGVNITSDRAFTGLFGHATDATIRNLTVKGKISCTYEGAQRYDNGTGVVGCAVGGTWVQNVTNYASITAACSAGGIVGFAYKDSNTSRNLIVQNSTNYGKVTSNTAKSNGCAAGIVGNSNALIADITVRECTNYAEINGYRYVGGIIGATQHTADAGIFYTTAIKCQNFGYVHSKNNDCGGIYGLAYYAKAENWRNYANVASDVTSRQANGGGIVGRAHVYVDVDACYSRNK